MGLWSGIKKVGGLYGKGLKGIGKGIGKVGKKLGREIRQGFDPITKGIKGDWRGALAGIGHNIKRAAQVGAVVGTGGVAGVGLGAIGAAGGALEGGFKEGGGGLGDIAGGAISGYGGVKGAQTVGNIGRGVAGKVAERGAIDVAGKVGERGAVDVASGIGGSGALPAADTAITNTMLGPPPSIPAAPGFLPSVPQGADWGNIAMTGGGDTSNIGRSLAGRAIDAGGDYLSENKANLAMKAVGQFAGGGGGVVDERPMPGAEPMTERARRLREQQALMQEMAMGGGPQFQQYSGRWR